MYLHEELGNRSLELLALYEAGAPLWLPDLGNEPQTMAYLSNAKVIGYGGAAGGGKSDLGIGKAINQHNRSFILRRVGTELQPLIDRLGEIFGGMDGYTGGNKQRWNLGDDNLIDFGAAPNLGDEQKYQGRPHDFKFFDEATNFLESQVLFLKTWLRNTRYPEITNEVLMTFNPPQDAEGRWVISYFSPWLDPRHPNPAAHGELRYFVTIDKAHFEVADQTPCVIQHKEIIYDFDPQDFAPSEIIIPESRTFIASRVTDNKYQTAEYMATLQSLPEPLRSQMLNGDFMAGIQDDEWQVIPTAWVEKAQQRWREMDRRVKDTMDSVGVDVARGGADNTIIIRRHEDMFFDEPLAYPGTQTPDGPTVMALIAAAIRDDAAVHLDVVGVGSSPFDFLDIARFRVIGVNGGTAVPHEVDKASGKLGFTNMKSLLWWRMREALDPTANNGIALPPDRQLMMDLTAPRWKAVGAKIKVETREEIIKRIGRSPDWGSACVLANMHTPRMAQLRTTDQAQQGHDPFAIEQFGHRDEMDYDPMDYD